MKEVLTRFKMTKKVIVTLVMLTISAEHSNTFGSDIIDRSLEAKKPMAMVSRIAAMYFDVADKQSNAFGSYINHEKLETKKTTDMWVLLDMLVLLTAYQHENLQIKEDMIKLALTSLAAQEVNDFGSNIDYNNLDVQKSIRATIEEYTSYVSFKYALESRMIATGLVPCTIDFITKEATKVVPQAARTIISLLRPNTFKALNEGLENMDLPTDSFSARVSLFLAIAIFEKKTGTTFDERLLIHKD